MQNNKLRKIVLPQVMLRTIGISHTQAPLLWPQKYDSQGRRMPLNAYALDFYKHGSLIGLVQDNRYVLFASVCIATSVSLHIHIRVYAFISLSLSLYLHLYSSPSPCWSLALSL